MLRLPSFTYLQPKALQEALQMKADAGPTGMYVAGGTDLYPNMKRRHQTPAMVISLAGIKALRRMGGSAGGPVIFGIGAKLTGPAPKPKLQSCYPGLPPTPL